MTSRLKRAIRAGAAAAIFGALAAVLPWLLAAEESIGLLALFRLRGPLPAPHEVAVVAIAGASADALGLSSDLDEWPRRLHAQVIGQLAKAGVAGIVMDIIFEAPSNAEDDGALGSAIGEFGRVALIERVRVEEPASPSAAGIVHERRVEPIPELRGTAWATGPFVLPSVPIRVWQYWTFGRGAGDVANLPVIALQMHALPHFERFRALLLEQTASNPAWLPRTAVELEDMRGMESVVADLRRLFLMDANLATRMRSAIEALPRTDLARAPLGALVDGYSGRDARYLNYYGPAGTIRTVPYHVVAEADDGALGALDLEGRIVFVGYSERRQPEQQDDFLTVFSERTGLSLSGVEIGATAFANLASGRGIRSVPMWVAIVLNTVWAGALAFGFALASSRLAIAAAALVGLAYFFVARYAFVAGLWMPIVVPLGLTLPLTLLGTLAVNYREIEAQRRRIEVALGRYVPAPAVRRLAQETLGSEASRELVLGTCLVSDAEHFTRVAETLTPQALHDLVGQYFGVLGRCVERHGGFVADVSGDSMVAVWAGVTAAPALRRNACRAGLDALRAVDEFNADKGRHGLPTGIGLDSGELLLGDIAFADRSQYRAIGDIVNTASRIQGLNRQLGTCALASAATVESLPELPSRVLGEFVLYGKANAVIVHELLDESAAGIVGNADALAAFAAALGFFRQRDWTHARTELEAVLAAVPRDGPSRFYLRQCELMASASLPAGWAGAIRMTAK